MTGVADCGNLLTAAGFTLPTVDSDAFTIEYPSVPALWERLQAMGESNAALTRRGGSRRDTLLAAAAAHAAMSPPSSEPGDGAVPAASVMAAVARGPT